MNEALPSRTAPRYPAEFARDSDYVTDVLRDGTRRGRERAAEVMESVRRAMKIDYFS